MSSYIKSGEKVVEPGENIPIGFPIKSKGKRTFTAAAKLVSMVSDLRVCGYDDQSYHEAVVLAIAALYVVGKEGLE